MEGDLLKAECTARGYPIYSQIKSKQGDHVFETIMVNSSSNVTHIGSATAGTLINTYVHHVSLPKGEYPLVCEAGFLSWSDNLDTHVRNSSSIAITVIGGAHL